jgi:hypothetical protein
MNIGKTFCRRIGGPAVVLAVIAFGLCAQTANADPLFFSNLQVLQNNVSVEMFANSGVTLFGPSLSFSVDVSGTLVPGAVDQLQITYLEAGSAPVIQTFDIPFGQIQPPFTIFFSVVSPGANAQGVAATLTIDLLNSSPDFTIPYGANQGQQVNSYTYSFTVAQPVPEPLTLVTLSTGLISLVAFRRRRN